MEDIITLKSGKRIYANCLILGISPNLSISEGYDGTITWMPDDYREDPNWDGLSPDDICELADIAIDRWQRLKAFVSV